MPISTEDQAPSTNQVPETVQWQAHRRRTSSKSEPAHKRKFKSLCVTSLSLADEGEGQVDAELEALRSPNAHKPVLKGVGKSDCEVRIVSIAECENEVSWESLGTGGDGG